MYANKGHLGVHELAPYMNHKNLGGLLNIHDLSMILKCTFYTVCTKWQMFPIQCGDLNYGIQYGQLAIPECVQFVLPRVL